MILPGPIVQHSLRARRLHRGDDRHDGAALAALSPRACRPMCWSRCSAGLLRPARHETPMWFSIVAVVVNIAASLILFTDHRPIGIGSPRPSRHGINFRPARRPRSGLQQRFPALGHDLASGSPLIRYWPAWRWARHLGPAGGFSARLCSRAARFLVRLARGGPHHRWSVPALYFRPSPFATGAVDRTQLKRLLRRQRRGPQANNCILQSDLTIVAHRD